MLTTVEKSVSFSKQQSPPKGHTCPSGRRQIHNADVAASRAVEVLQPDVEGFRTIQKLRLQLNSAALPNVIRNTIEYEISWLLYNAIDIKVVTAESLQRH